MAEIIDNEAINNRLNDEGNNEPTELPTNEDYGVYKVGVDPLQNLSSTPDPATVSVTKVVAEAKVRKPRTVTPAKSTPSAKVDVGSAIQKLEEKVKLLKYVESVTVPEVPTGMSKEGREILLQIGREMEELKARKIAAITKL